MAKKTIPNSRIFSIVLDVEDKEKVEAIAQSNMLSTSAQMRLIVRDYLERNSKRLLKH